MLRTEQPDAVHQVRVAARRLRSIARRLPAGAGPGRDRAAPGRAPLAGRGARRRPGRRGGARPPARRRGSGAGRAGARPGGRPAAADRDPRGAGRARPGAAHAVRTRGTCGCWTTCTPCSPSRRSPAGPATRRGRCSATPSGARRSGCAASWRPPAQRRTPTAARGAARGAQGRQAGPVHRRDRHRRARRRRQPLVEAAKEVQTALGERAGHRASPASSAAGSGSRPSPAGENALTYGRLHALEQARAERAERAFWELEPTLRRRSKRAAR